MVRSAICVGLLPAALKRARRLFQTSSSVSLAFLHPTDAWYILHSFACSPPSYLRNTLSSRILCSDTCISACQLFYIYLRIFPIAALFSPKNSFSRTSVQTPYGTCISISYVLDCLRHSGFRWPPFVFPGSVGRPHLYIHKRSFLVFIIALGSTEPHA